MKTKSLLLASLLSLAFAMNLHAGPRVSANYTITTDTTDTGGKRATSAAYTNSGSAGGIAGRSTVVAPAETAKSGFLAQLYDITGLTLTAVSLNVNEGATVQLGAWQALDDATFLAVPAASVAWSVQSGPLTGISASGLATAGLVYQDTAATAQGIYLGQTGTLGLTVKNVATDDFGLYAGDGIDDAWQFQYFGADNPLAAPTLDPDGDGETNLFEFTAGLVPTDPQSRFILNLAPVGGQPTQRSVVFSPLVAGRTYTVQYKLSLADPTWQTLTGATVSDNGTTRTVTDTVGGAMKFYRVQVNKP